MHYFERNSKLLSEYQLEVFKKLNTEPKLSFPNISVGFGQNESGIVDNVVIKVGDQLFADSKGADSEQWVSNVNPDMNTIIVLGFGLGYHIEKLLEKHPGKKVIIIEPDKRVLVHALHVKNFENVIKHTEIWLDEDVNTVKMKIYELLTHPLARGILIMPYVMLYQEYTTEFVFGVQKIINDWAVMVNTKRCLVDKWYENRFQNLKVPAANAVSLMGKFQGIPGILVGAGPSLKGQIELLKSLQGKAVIIAASTAAEILHTHGIKSTFMIAIDQDPLTSGGLHEHMDSDTPLLYDGQVAQNSLNYKGKKFQFCLNVNKYTGMVIPDLPVLESGPSVANVALDLLNKLGCSPISVIGMDLSYTNDKLYCDGTKFNQDMTQPNTIKLPNNKGEICSTEPSFLCMKHWFEEYVKRNSPTVYNCTEKGLIIEHMLNRDFAEVAQGFTQKYDFDSIIADCYKIQAVNPTVNRKLVEDLTKMRQLIETEKNVTSGVNHFSAWILVDEFVQSLIYIEEIRSEERIKKGMPTGESIKIFQNKRTEIIINAIDKLICMLS